MGVRPAVRPRPLLGFVLSTWVASPVHEKFPHKVRYGKIHRQMSITSENPNVQGQGRHEQSSMITIGRVR